MKSFLTCLLIIFLFNNIGCLEDPTKNKAVCSGTRTTTILYCGTSQHLRFGISTTVEQDTPFQISSEDCGQLVENKTLNYMGSKLSFEFESVPQFMTRQVVVEGDIQSTGQCSGGNFHLDGKEYKSHVMIVELQIKIEREDTQQLSTDFEVFDLDALENRSIEATIAELKMKVDQIEFVVVFYMKVHGLILCLIGLNITLKMLYKWRAQRREHTLISNV